LKRGRVDYNQRRPHGSLGPLTPTEFIEQRQAIRVAEEVALYRSRFLRRARGDTNIAPPSSIVDPGATVRSRFIGQAAIARARAATGV